MKMWSPCSPVRGVPSWDWTVYSCMSRKSRGGRTRECLNRPVGPVCGTAISGLEIGSLGSFAMAVKTETGDPVYHPHQPTYPTTANPSDLSQPHSHTHYHRPSLPFDFSFAPTPGSSSSTGFPLDPSLDSFGFRRMSGSANARPSSSQFDHAQPSAYSHPPPSRQPYSSFAVSPGGFKDPGLNWLDSIFDPSGFSSSFDGIDPGTTSGNVYGQGQGVGGFASDQAQLLSLESPEHLLANLQGSGSSGVPVSGSLNLLLNPMKREPQLEDVTSWANISHFISLFLQYLYPLLPLVHRPTFAEHLATRRDKKDMDFRALLLSIGQYGTAREVNRDEVMLTL